MNTSTKIEQREEYLSTKLNRVMNSDPELNITLLDNAQFKKEAVVREDVEGVNGAFLLHKVLTTEECQSIVEQVFASNGASLEDANPVLWREWSENPKEEYKKLGIRIIRKSEAYSEALFQRVKDHLPKVVETTTSKEKLTWDLSGLSERIRFIKYDAGQQFPPHTDGPYVKTDVISSHYTALFYLDKSGGTFSLNSDFRGGELYFLRDTGKTLTRLFKVTPEPGLVVVFPHRTLHEGHSLKSGHKYLIRSDVMYTISKREPLSAAASASSPSQSSETTEPSAHPTEYDQH